MSDARPLNISTGPSETVLPAPDPAALEALAAAQARPSGAERRAALLAVAGAHPGLLEAWASLAEDEREPVEAYAFARVGYHRGLDFLRAAGWRGSGLVRWEHPSNRGFLRSLQALGRAAAAIGEHSEAIRCEQFLHQLDPAWGRAQAPGSSAR